MMALEESGVQSIDITQTPCFGCGLVLGLGGDEWVGLMAPLGRPQTEQKVWHLECAPPMIATAFARAKKRRPSRG